MKFVCKLDYFHYTSPVPKQNIEEYVLKWCKNMVGSETKFGGPEGALSFILDNLSRRHSEEILSFWVSSMGVVWRKIELNINISIWFKKGRMLIWGRQKEVMMNFMIIYTK